MTWYVELSISCTLDKQTAATDTSSLRESYSNRTEARRAATVRDTDDRRSRPPSNSRPSPRQESKVYILSGMTMRVRGLRENEQ